MFKASQTWKEEIGMMFYVQKLIIIMKNFRQIPIFVKIELNMFFMTRTT